MRMADVKKHWLEDNKTWIKEHESDKIMINEAYLAYVDALCKDGIITERQYNNMTNIYYYDWLKEKWYKS